MKPSEPHLEQTLREWFRNCSDVRFMTLALGEREDIRWLVVYCEGITDCNAIPLILLPQLSRLKPGDATGETVANSTLIPVGPGKEEVAEALFSGQLLAWAEGMDRLLALDSANPPQRKTEESNTEVSVKGPRDGFTEDLTTNMALIRKRLHTADLVSECFVIGSKSRTDVLLLYMEHSVDPVVLETVRSRLGSVHTEVLTGSEQLIGHLSGKRYGLFPLLDYIGRPDFVVESLIRGRFCILVDGTPIALLAPVNLTSLIKTPEDIHNAYFYVLMEYTLRLLGFALALFLPGFYVALTSFHPDQVPFSLLATLVNVRRGLPLPAPLEAFLMQLMFELFREAGIRLPKGVGQTVTVVGGLFIGQAAIDAGITSPSMLVVTAVSVVSQYTLVNQSLGGIVTLFRLVILLFSSLLGLYGYFLAVFLLVVYLARQESFGVPYLAPYSPLQPKRLVEELAPKPRLLTKLKPRMQRKRLGAGKGRRHE